MGRVKKPVEARPATNARAKAKAEPRAEPQRIQVICKTLLCRRENQPDEAVGGIRTCCSLCSGSNSQQHTTLCQERFKLTLWPRPGPREGAPQLPANFYDSPASRNGPWGILDRPSEGVLDDSKATDATA